MPCLEPHASYGQEFPDNNPKVANIEDIIAWYKFEHKDNITSYALENHINFYLTKHSVFDCENVPITNVKVNYKNADADDDQLGINLVGYNGDINLGTIYQEYPGGSIFCNYSMVGV